MFGTWKKDSLVGPDWGAQKVNTSKLFFLLKFLDKRQSYKAVWKDIENLWKTEMATSLGGLKRNWVSLWSTGILSAVGMKSQFTPEF